jgi:hypothetical protein
VGHASNVLTASIIACVLGLGMPTVSAASIGDGQNPLSKAGKVTKGAAKKAGDVTEVAARSPHPKQRISERRLKVP